MLIIGISAFYHDSAAVLLKEGEIVAAAQEERFTRKKHDRSFPVKSLRYCLKEGRTSLREVNHIVFYEKPFLKFERLLETCLSEAPRGFTFFTAAMPVWLKEKLFLKKTITGQLLLIEKMAQEEVSKKLLFSEHHQSHAGSAFYPSPFEEAVILTVDGVGEWTTTSMALGKGNSIEILKEIHFPHSLGLLYSAFTYYIGFKVNSGEYKVMGLAPYGTPRFANVIRDELIDIKEDGSFCLNMNYFNYTIDLTMTNTKFHSLFGAPPRNPESPLTQREMDLAASIQQVTEEAMLKLATSARKETASRNLCLAGGVALNCVVNGKILREGIFDNVWIAPASGDAGGALGAAYCAYYQELGHKRIVTGDDAMKGGYLGISFSDSEVEETLLEMNAVYHRQPDEDTLMSTIAEALADGKVVGWHQGRMEFGPRALGSRSILGDARNITMQSAMNMKIKFRESFRPFAPCVLRERVNDYFELDADSPYMLLVAEVRQEKRVPLQPGQEKLEGLEKLAVPRSVIPAVTHVDYSARIQTVHRNTNPRLHSLLRRFEEKTGCPVLVNSSFNVRGEPIVCSPADSYRCFMRTGMDMLAIENSVLYKEEQPSYRDEENWRETFELD